MSLSKKSSIMNDKILEGIVSALEEVHSNNQKRPDKYIVAYYRKKDDKLLGYHLSTFCQLTDVRLDAKRYNGEDPTEQLKIIRKNLDYALDLDISDSEKLEGFDKVTMDIKNTYFKGYTKEDIYIYADYIGDNVPNQEKTFVVSKNDKNDY